MPATPNPPKRIVIVEDQTAVREMIAQIVELEPGMKVVAETGEGHAACQICLEHKPDLIILDLMLPGLNGTEVLRRVSKVLTKTRVLVFSGYYNPGLIRDLVQCGAHGFVEKSAPLAELRKGLQIVAAGGSYFGPAVSQFLREAMMPVAEGGAGSMEDLTAREREVLQLIAESYSTRAIATKLNVSVKTAENHRTNLMKKLRLHDVASIVRFAVEKGLVDPGAQNI